MNEEKELNNNIQIENNNLPVEYEEDSSIVIESPLTCPINEISLRAKPKEILNMIDSAETMEELKDYTKLFHVSLSKKEASRALTKSELLDALLEQASERIMKRPDEMSHKDLLDYMNILQTSLDKTAKSLDSDIVEAPPLTLNQTNQEININVNDGTSMSLNDASRMKILEVLNAITKSNASTTIINNEDEKENNTND